MGYHFQVLHFRLPEQIIQLLMRVERQFFYKDKFLLFYRCRMKILPGKHSVGTKVSVIRQIIPADSSTVCMNTGAVRMLNTTTSYLMI